jgi:phosphate-selective porin OprO/OprP
MRDALNRFARLSFVAGLLLAAATILRAQGPTSDTLPVKSEVASVVAKTDAVPAADKEQRLLVSPSGKFRIELGGRLQVLYQYAAPDAATNEKLYGPTFANRPTPEATSLFRIRRGRVGLEGFLYDPSLQFNVQLELAGQSMSLKRSYVNYRMAGSALQLRAGKFKVPFGRQQLTSIFNQQLVERSLVSDDFAKGDDDGVMLWGEPSAGRVEYYLGAFNGEGNNRNSQQDAANQLALRVAVSPLGKMPYAGPATGTRTPRFAIGANANVNGGWLTEVNGVPGMQAPMETCTAGACVTDFGDDARITVAGIDAAMRWNGIAWIAERFRRAVDPREPGLATLESHGWYTQLGGFVVRDRVELGARVGRLDPAVAASNDEIRESSSFLNVYIRGTEMKIQTDFTLVRTQIASATAVSQLNDGRLRTQLTLTF